MKAVRSISLIRRVVAVAAMSSGLIVCSELRAAVSLFNGTDLNGWTKLGGQGTYTVAGNEIVGVSAQPSSPNTFLVTNETYGDFALDVDFFISDPDFNSGIQLRSQSLLSHNNGRVFGYQAEIDPSERAWTGGIYFEGGSPDRPAGWLDDLDDNPAAQSAFALGEWNHFRIIAEGRRIQTWINGVPAVDYTDHDPTAFLASGFIGLQVHQVTTNEPREVRWRNIVLSSIPTLVVNRENGLVSLRNQMEVPVDFISYSIGSPSGSLNGAPGRWQSLSDQGEAGWTEGSIADTLLQEATIGDVFSLEPDNSHSLGAAYVPRPIGFGVDAEDLNFQFGEDLNGLLPGRVEYVGQNVANNLVLFVDPVSGQTVLKNTSTFAVEVTGYSILSESNSLREANWQSLADRNLIGWDEVPLELPGISELSPHNSLLFEPGDAYNLGNIYDTADALEDLQLEFLVNGEMDSSIGAVLYRLPSDFNLDEIVDARDLGQWQGAYGVSGAGDANGDGDSDGHDFLTWQAQTGMSTVAAALPMPEPTGCLLAVLGAATCLHTREILPLSRLRTVILPIGINLKSSGGAT